MEKFPVHQALDPLKWIIGKWICKSGAGQYPTISNFKYCEQIEFQSYGQPLLTYTAKSWHPEKKAPMHFESGFLRINPGTKNVSFMLAHNLGLTTLEEGEIDGESVLLKTSSISRMSFAKDPAVTKIERLICLQDGKLQQILSMATTNTPMTEHLKCVYEKVTCDDQN